MGLMDELKLEHWGPPNKCSVHKLANTMPPKDRDELLQAVNEGVVPATVIERVLAKRGLVLKQASIQRHRRKECGCD
jgi:hypothetical protein